MTALWSEGGNSLILILFTVIPDESTKSSVWPLMWVGPVTDCTRLKDSYSLIKSATNAEFEGQQTRRLKSLKINSLLYWGKIIDRRLENSSRKAAQ